jgi:polysaccharide export outer membrane protein
MIAVALKIAGIFGLLLAGLLPAIAANDLLLPQTKLRVTVVQWNPAKSDYQSWQAIGGEFIVSQSGMLELPVIGQIEAAGRDSTALAGEISTRLQSHMGLIDRPDTTVEILEYPPIYVLGDVTTPGEYKYRPNLTALQALALSGGPFRQAGAGSDTQIRLAGELRGIHSDIIHSKVRIARLNAEMAGAAQVTFPPMEPGDAASEADIEVRERIIFETRIKERDRQTKSLEELRDLLNAEIDVLQEKVKAADIGVKNARDELANVSVLVEKGIAIASRRSELEHTLANYQADRLDQVTAIMRARQNITETTRNLEGLEDKQRTEVAGALQQEQANLQKLLLNQEVSQKLLLETLASAAPSAKSSEAVDFMITRYMDGRTSEIATTESTPLMPGDVITVRLKPAAFPNTDNAVGAPAVLGSLSATDSEAMEASR